MTKEDRIRKWLRIGLIHWNSGQFPDPRQHEREWVFSEYIASVGWIELKCHLTWAVGVVKDPTPAELAYVLSDVGLQCKDWMDSSRVTLLYDPTP